MAKTSKKRHGSGFLGLVFFAVLIGLVLFLRHQLDGNNVALFNPKGLIAHEQHNLMLYVGGILLAVAIPTILLLYFTAWKYRESNSRAAYQPDMHHGKWVTIGTWGVPAICMLILASIMYPATHRLAPRKAIAADTKPLTIQVISMRWKWLFIYPEQKIATVNFVQVPVHVPVQFELTADTAPMSSFWIPNLGGQLYSMTGHVNRVNLMADTMGDYPGSSAEINGAGFAGMKFIARASSRDDFDQWVQNVKQSPNILDDTEYARVLSPSENNPAEFYSTYDRSIYTKVVAKYEGPGGGHTHAE